MLHLPILLEGTAPEWSVSQWLGADAPSSLESLRGRVVLLECFQMLCPGCVTHGLPQAVRAHEFFPRERVVVLGLHTVFEHHAAMGPVSLTAFLHEYRIPFPVGIDRATDRDIPETMQRFKLRGTPSLLLFDTHGRLRAHHFGQTSDLRLGAEVTSLLAT